MVTHHKDFSVSMSPRPFVELESFSVKPARARLLVICKRKPEPFELSDLLGVLVSQKVNDVGDVQASEPLDVGPRSYHAAKG